MEPISALRNSFFSNMSKSKNISFNFWWIIDKELNNERIKHKIELRHNEISNILFSKRKIREMKMVKKEDNLNLNENNIKFLKNIEIPDDFQLKAYSYYESVVFL